MRQKVVLAVFLVLIVEVVQAEKIILPVAHLCEHGTDIKVRKHAHTCGPCSLEMIEAYLQRRQPDFSWVMKFNSLLEKPEVKTDYFLRHGRDISFGEMDKMIPRLYGFIGIKRVAYSREVIASELEKGAPVFLCVERMVEISNRPYHYGKGHYFVICGVDGNRWICQDPNAKSGPVSYLMSEVEAAKGSYNRCVYIGFYPMKLEEKRVEGDHWRVFFNFAVGKTSLPDTHIDEGALIVPLERRGYSAYGRIESVDHRVWEGNLTLPRYVPEENERPLLELVGRYFVGGHSGMPLLAPSFKVELWIVEQKGNHLLIVTRWSSRQVGLGPEQERYWESVAVRDVILTRINEPEGRYYYAFAPGLTTRWVKLEGESRRGTSSYYIYKQDAKRIRLVLRDVATGRKFGTFILRPHPAPPWPPEVTPEEMEKVRREAGF